MSKIIMLLFCLLLSALQTRAGDSDLFNSSESPIDNLSDDLMPIVLEFVDPADLFVLSSVSHRFHNLVGKHGVHLTVSNRSLDKFINVCQMPDLPYVVKSLSFEINLNSREDQERFATALSCLSMNSIGQYPAIIKNITDLKIAGDPNIANRLDDEGVKNILTLPELNFLTLENVTISDEASVHFASSNITSLNFIPQNITSRTLISALSCSHLRHLTIKKISFIAQHWAPTSDLIVMSPSLTHLNLEMNPLPLEILKGISKLKTLKELSLAGIPNTFTLDSAFTKSILEGGMKSVKLTGKYIIGDSLVLPALISHFSDKQLSIYLDDRENVNNSIDVNHSGQSRLNFSMNQDAIHSDWLQSALYSSEHQFLSLEISPSSLLEEIGKCLIRLSENKNRGFSLEALKGDTLRLLWHPSDTHQKQLVDVRCHHSQVEQTLMKISDNVKIKFTVDGGETDSAMSYANRFDNVIELVLNNKSAEFALRHVPLFKQAKNLKRFDIRSKNINLAEDALWALSDHAEVSFIIDPTMQSLHFTNREYNDFENTLYARYILRSAERLDDFIRLLPKTFNINLEFKTQKEIGILRELLELPNVRAIFCEQSEPFEISEDLAMGLRQASHLHLFYINAFHVSFSGNAEKTLDCFETHGSEKFSALYR